MNIITFNNAKKIIYSVLFLTAAAISLSSCLKSDNNDTTPDMSNLMIVNTCTWAPDGIVWAYNGNLVNKDSIVNYSTNSRYYFGLWRGATIAFYKSSQTSNNSYLTAGYAPGNNTNYSIFVTGKGDSSFIVKDDVKKLDATKAAVRFVNASASIGVVDIEINGTKTTGVKFSSGTNPEFKEFTTEGNTEFVVNVYATGTTTLLSSLRFTPKAQESHTVYLRGKKDATGMAAIGLSVINNTKFLPSSPTS